VIKKFGIAGVSPPISPEDLDPKIKELKERLIKLSEEGEKELELEKQEMAKNIDRVVEEDLERERKEAMDEEYGQEEEKEERRYRGRGGRRGGRGGRRYGDYSPEEREEKDTSGGYFGKKFGVKP